MPPAYYAVRQGNIEGLDLLAKAGGDLKYHKDYYGLMHLAARSNDVPVLAKLAALGLSVDDAQAPSGFTPLMAAAGSGANASAVWLLQHGASLSGRDQAGRSVLDYARRSNTLGIDAFFRRAVLDPLGLKAP